MCLITASLLLGGCMDESAALSPKVSKASAQSDGGSPEVAQRSAENPTRMPKEPQRIEKDEQSGWFEGVMEGDSSEVQAQSDNEPDNDILYGHADQPPQDSTTQEEAPQQEEPATTGEPATGEATLADGDATTGDQTTSDDTASVGDDPQVASESPDTGDVAPEEITNDSLNDGTETAEEGTADSSAPSRLSWAAPLTREDGSKLYPGEIAHYRIYYRSGDQDTLATLELPDSKTSLELGQFEPGVYEFSVTAVDVNGLESRRSGAVEVAVTL